MSSGATAEARSGRPRLGFLGTGWIGRNRLEAVVNADIADVVAISDPSEEMTSAARALAPEADVRGGIDELLEIGLDGLVVATPSALHAEQSCRALEAGIPVFCQKPLGRNAREVRKVVSAAKRANKLLMVDFSYRYIDGARTVRNLARSGEFGEIFAADLKFHNAYGPDKPWFFDRKLSGGGCLIDLGVHLVDLLLWTLDFPAVYEVSGHLRSKGRRLDDKSRQVEDYACGEFQAADCLVQLACSWNLNAGDTSFDREAERFVTVASVLDQMYGR